jgi:hypothetical protein
MLKNNNWSHYINGVMYLLLILILKSYYNFVSKVNPLSLMGPSKYESNYAIDLLNSKYMIFTTNLFNS